MGSQIRQMALEAIRYSAAIMRRWIHPAIQSRNAFGKELVAQPIEGCTSRVAEDHVESSKPLSGDIRDRFPSANTIQRHRRIHVIENFSLDGAVQYKPACGHSVGT